MYEIWIRLKAWKKSLLVFVSFTICALVASEPFVTFRSSLRKGEPSWSVTLTWSRPLSLTSLHVLISYFLCLCVSVSMYVCFSRCYFHETTKGRRRWVLILKRNIVVFAVSEYSPTYLHLLMSHKRESRFRIPKFRFRILKSRKVLLVKSGILDFGIRKTAQGTWIPLMIGFRNPSFNDKESGIQYLEAEIHGLESRRRRQKTVLAFLCIGRICDCNTKNTTRVRITLLK